MIKAKELKQARKEVVANSEKLFDNFIEHNSGVGHVVFTKKGPNRDLYSFVRMNEQEIIDNGFEVYVDEDRAVVEW